MGGGGGRCAGRKAVLRVLQSSSQLSQCVGFEHRNPLHQDKTWGGTGRVLVFFTQELKPMDSCHLAPSWIFLFLFIRALVWNLCWNPAAQIGIYSPFSPFSLINREADTHTGQVKDLEQQEINENVIPFSLPGRSQALPSETAVCREDWSFFLNTL